MIKVFNLLILLPLFAFFQSTPEPLDGPNRPFHDDLLDNLQGQWKLKGNIAGHPAEAELEAAWVLNHQFLKVHEKAKDQGRNLMSRRILHHEMCRARFLRITTLILPAASV